MTQWKLGKFNGTADAEDNAHRSPASPESIGGSLVSSSDKTQLTRKHQ